MKNKNQITKLLRRIFTVAMVTGLAACTADPVEMWGGKLPDQEALESTYGILRSNKSAESNVDLLLTEGAGFVTDNIYYQITKPTPVDQSLDMWVNGSLLDQYNKENAEHRKLLPEVNYDFPDGKKLAVVQDGKRSLLRRIRILAKDLAPGEYLLPITVAAADADPKVENQTLYYSISIRARQLGDHELHQGEDIFFVFYINTNNYQPLLVDDYFMEKKPRRGSQVIWHKTIGNIINLRTVILDYNAATGRAMLNLGSDMRYVLNHVTKYIRPLQDKGRKVCLSLEGGGKGVGFCNLTDAQITDFVAQVKIVVEQYGLDGINLWDRNAGYGKVGAPAMNTTSYPKLIVALRAALGSDKLLTLTDHEKPTESFHDITATGGIEVGKYIDYAWSGYNDERERIQICDPWHPDGTDVSTHTHKPIAGLASSKYGCVNVPWYKASADLAIKECEYVGDWVQDGNKQSKILVCEDLRTILQDAYESSWGISDVCGLYADDGVVSRSRYKYMQDFSRLGELPSGKNGYGKWLKDW